MTSLTSGSVYRSMSDEQKAKTVANVYTYANEVAKEATVKSYKTGDNWINEARDDSFDYGIPVSDYIALYSSGISDIHGIEGNNGKSIPNTAGLRKAKKIYETMPGLSDTQYKKLMEDFGVGETVRKMSRQQIYQECAKYGE